MARLALLCLLCSGCVLTPLLLEPDAEKERLTVENQTGHLILSVLVNGVEWLRAPLDSGAEVFEYVEPGCHDVRAVGLTWSASYRACLTDDPFRVRFR